MGSANSQFKDIPDVLHILKQAVGEITDSISSLSCFDPFYNAGQYLLTESNELSDEQRKVIQLIVVANKDVATALNVAKNLVSDVKALCTTLSEVINSNAGSNDKKIIFVISVFEKRMGVLLPELANASDKLFKANEELKSITTPIKNLLRVVYKLDKTTNG